MNHESRSEDTETVVTVDSLCSEYGGRRILNAIDFKVNRGEIFVIMGRSGSGKTTLLRHLVGLRRPTSGRVSILGKSIFEISRSELFAVRLKTGVAFQTGALINSMTLIDNIELPLKQNTQLDSSTIRIMSRMKLEMMAIADAEDLMPSELSGGMLKRAGLARAMVMDPEILFFDEPSSGLDPVTSAELDEQILGLRSALGITIIAITHDLESALKVADRILVLNEGQILEIGTVNEIRNSRNESVQLLLSRQARARRFDDSEYIDRLTADEVP